MTKFQKNSPELNAATPNVNQFWKLMKIILCFNVFMDKDNVFKLILKYFQKVVCWRRRYFWNFPRPKNSPRMNRAQPIFIQF